MSKGKGANNEMLLQLQKANKEALNLIAKQKGEIDNFKQT